jgi:hypothetical protein
MVRTAEASDPLADQDKRKGTRHSRTAVVSSHAEPAKRHELKTLITLVFADYASKPLAIHLLETVCEKASSESQPSRHD